MTPVAIAMPLPLAEHPQVRRHAEKLRTLQEKVTATNAAHATLVAERAGLQQARHLDGVAAALDDRAAVPADRARAARLAALDAEIDRAGHDVHALQDALQLHTGLGETIRAEATAELRQQAEASAVAVVAAMRPLVAQLEPLNRQLIALAEAGGFSVPACALLIMWLDQFHAGGR